MAINEKGEPPVELLAPAGNLEKLKMAVIYGADAVYFGGEEFGLRASAGNFGPEDMKEGISFAHSRGKKASVTMNIDYCSSDYSQNQSNNHIPAFSIC